MKATQDKIVPNLWFDTQAKEAIDFYVSLFPDSKSKSSTTLEDTPSGNTSVFTFSLWGQNFMAINGGPMFKINQSISFFVYCGSEEMIKHLYHKLIEDGKIFLALEEYLWSKQYAWIEDKFGVTWQLEIADIDSEQKILPCLLFVNDKMTLVKEAANFYTGIFSNSKIVIESPYTSQSEIPEEILLFSQISLGDYRMNLMSSDLHHDFDFNEAVSLIVYCDNQEEIDYYWDKFTAKGQEQPCGWVKDEFGVSWQIVPREMAEMMTNGTKDQLARVTQAFLTMKKFDIKTLRQAYDNK